VTGVTTLDMLDGCRYGDAAVVMAGTGCAAAVPTALTGWSDWLDTTGAERRVGLVHAAANSAAVLLYATSWLAPRRSPGRGRQHHCPRCGRAFGRGLARRPSGLRALSASTPRHSRCARRTGCPSVRRSSWPRTPGAGRRPRHRRTRAAPRRRPGGWRTAVPTGVTHCVRAASCVTVS
jgi:hypothetical protein